MQHIRASYLLSLRALELASDRVKEACKGEDMDAAAIEAHFALHAVYDLHEAYFIPRGVSATKDQDTIYSREDGQVVGALAVARAARTHELVTFARTGGFPDKPYGMGPYGPGWIWKEHSWTDHRYTTRSIWHEKRVRHRLLWSPLDEAWGWFLNRIPE
ncbi:hypothetical protein [Paenarthrobacter ureafaciens]|uniref:hypothetical protein n=1 Tax=Paenarthrobacter ureafaciens TaxID=37931 RepID=UPI002DBE710F|nr:hypothetical protein [Paenarthrobacter ureafaciens]MEC3853196.1 hypothetical protein [Paenarthrobacter ureafaciens]